VSLRGGKNDDDDDDDDDDGEEDDGDGDKPSSFRLLMLSWLRIASLQIEPAVRTRIGEAQRPARMRYTKWSILCLPSVSLSSVPEHQEQSIKRGKSSA
jgi:hypothetical protein